MAQGNDNQLPGNDPDLTEAEIAARDGFDDDGNAVEAPAGSDAATAAKAGDEYEGAGASADDVAAAAEEGADAAAAEGADASASNGAASTPVSTAGPVFTPTITPGAPRDFAAEIKELKAQYEAGTIDDDAYEEAREGIVEARTLYNAQATIAEQLAEQGWRANVGAFLQLPENAALLRSPEMKDLWQTMMNRTVTEAAEAGRTLADWEILSGGRDRLFQTLGISTTPVPEAPAAAPPKPNQAPPLGNVPPTLAKAPAAAPSGAKTTAETLAGSDNIMEIEAFMATQSEEQADALLRSLPGAFAD